LGHQHLLVVRFALFNIVALGFVFAFYLQGWLDGVLGARLVELSLLIVAVFAYGLVKCAQRVWQISQELNEVRAGISAPGGRIAQYMERARNGSDRGRLTDVLRLKLSNHIAIVRQVANTLVFLGLIGTVIGFIIALSGVNAEAVTDAQKVAPMVSTLIGGMSVAMNTTLIGAVLYVWLIVDHRILATGTLDLLITTVEAAESPGESPGESPRENHGTA